jgi:N-acetylglucosamine kinase-like BadF-type ATPase
MPAETHIGVDVGGGGIRIRAIVDGQRRKAQDRGPVPRSAGRIDSRALADRIAGLVTRLHPRRPTMPAGGDLWPDPAGVRADRVAVGGVPADRVAVGLTGMPGLLEDPAELAEHLHRQIATKSLIVAGDLLTTHLGALGGRPGCVVAAGTGVIVLGTDHAATWNRADGWGHLLGDAGSGAWIGAQGLAAALRQHDGRAGGSAALHMRLRHRFGDADSTVRAVYGSQSPAHELAGFAPDVAQAAHEGDPVAREIWHRAGVHLAEAAHAASRGLPPDFSWGGRLFDAGPLLLVPFRDELTKRVPGARLSPPSGQAADGALLLAQRGLSPDPTPYALEF